MNQGKLSKRPFILLATSSLLALSASVVTLPSLASPLLVEGDLRIETESSVESGGVINSYSEFEPGASFTTFSEAVGAPMQVFNWTNQITNDLQNEYHESLYAEAFAMFSLDATEVNSYEVTLNFSFDQEGIQYPQNLYAGSVINFTEEYFDAYPVSQQYTFSIAPGESMEYLWFYGINGAGDFSVQASSSLSVLSLRELIPNEVSEPSLWALMLLGTFGMARSRKFS